MPKTKGEGLMPYSRPLTRFSKYGAKQQTLRNIDAFLDHLYKLQNNGHQLAALDLSREALGAATDRTSLYKTDV